MSKALLRAGIAVSGAYLIAGLLGFNEWAWIWLKLNYYPYQWVYLAGLFMAAVALERSGIKDRVGWMAAFGVGAGLVAGSIAAILMGALGRTGVGSFEALKDPAVYWEAPIFALLVMAWFAGLIMAVELWTLRRRPAAAALLMVGATGVALVLRLAGHLLEWPRVWPRL
jgi:hypothetical protein